MTEDSLKEKIVRETVGIGLVALALFVFLSLASYDPVDPSFFSAASPHVKEIRNWMGIVGSYLAGALFQSFGFPSFVIPFILGAFAAGFIFRWPWKYLPLKIGSWSVLLLALSSFCGLWIPPMRLAHQSFLAGGFLGQFLAGLLSRFFNVAGATVLLLAALIVFFVLGTGLSFFGILRHGAGAAADLAERIRTQITVRKEQTRRAKKISKEKEKSEKPERPEPLPLSQPEVVTADEIPRLRKEIREQEAFHFLRSGAGFQLPPISLLEADVEKRTNVDRDSLLMNSRILEKKLLDYGVEGRVVEVRPGPVITVYEFEPAPGVKVSRISNLADDLALALSAISIRILAPIPGKAVVGIEIPNKVRETVFLKEIIDSDPFRASRSKLSFALGKDISGESFIVDLARMPHLLVAGSTGSGKSVSINAMICSILFKATPDEVRFLMVDPKMVELSDYDGIPHLLLPVVTNPKKAAAALNWLVDEMERRYTVLAEKGVRNIEHYHQKMEKDFKGKGKPPKMRAPASHPDDGAVPPEEADPFPYIVVVIDELADLMLVSSRDVEESITRLAQMARAVGIHLLLATQRPSVDVLTGIIKANFPARISFQVTSKVDSRTILDQIGAEHLLGSGDMIFLPPGSAKLTRVHGAYISGGEIKRVVEFIKQQAAPAYNPSIIEEVKKEKGVEGGGGSDEYDEKYDEAVAFVADTGQASISLIQRRFHIGYNRAARIIEKMEQEGVVGASDGIKARAVLVSKIE